MMIDEVLASEIDSFYVDSSRAEDLEVKVNAAAAAAFAAAGNRGSAEGWHLGGSGFGPSFMVVVEYSIDAPGANAITLSNVRFWFYSAANALEIVQHRAAAMQRIAAYAASVPEFNVNLVDSQLAGGTQGLTQMGMLVTAARTPA